MLVCAGGAALPRRWLAPTDVSELADGLGGRVKWSRLTPLNRMEWFGERKKSLAPDGMVWREKKKFSTIILVEA
jgi:hypothetical protein